MIVSNVPRESAFVIGHYRKLKKCLGTGGLQEHNDDVKFLPDGQGRI